MQTAQDTDLNEQPVRVEREILTDGSYVYNVRIGEALFHAVSEDDAFAFARTFVAAVDAHTVDSAAIYRAY